jgi:F-type H+-transporting ATPase subunit a
MQSSPLVTTVLFHLGPVGITRPVITTWVIIAILAAGSWLATRRLSLQVGRRHTLVEILVVAMLDHFSAVIGRDARPLLPLLGTLLIFLAVANLSGILPGVEAPTAKLETPASLALIVFFAVHYFGIRARGLFGYLGGFARPKLVMLPLNLLSEITRTFSLMVRLFGNVMSGEFVIGLVLALAGLFVPIPFMAIEILLGLVQAYIFTVLATVFIGAAIDASPS